MSLKARLFSREVLPFYLALGALMALTLLLDALLHVFNLVWIGRYLGIPGVLLILGSFGYSLRKRKLIGAGKPVQLLRWHEGMAWAGSLLVLVHAGIHFNAILGWLAVLAMLQATLTLPGIAAVVLTIGMAVDANIIIYERIREELRAGKSPRSAVQAGFGRAFWTVFDAHVTNLVAGVVLYSYGTGPIRGFAVSLMAGIVCNLFTSVWLSRAMFDWTVGRKKVATLSI
jgi:hypothetical protein